MRNMLFWVQSWKFWKQTTAVLSQAMPGVCKLGCNLSVSVLVLKQSTWLRFVQSGDWRLHLALRTPSGACQPKGTTNERYWDSCYQDDNNDMSPREEINITRYPTLTGISLPQNTGVAQSCHHYHHHHDTMPDDMWDPQVSEDSYRQSLKTVLFASASDKQSTDCTEKYATWTTTLIQSPSCCTININTLKY